MKKQIFTSAVAFLFSIQTKAQNNIQPTNVPHANIPPRTAPVPAPMPAPFAVFWFLESDAQPEARIEIVEANKISFFICSPF